MPRVAGEHMFGYHFSAGTSTCWGSGFDSLLDAIEAAVEDAASIPLEKRGKGILIYFTREGEVIASYLLA